MRSPSPSPKASKLHPCNLSALMIKATRHPALSQLLHLDWVLPAAQYIRNRTRFLITFQRNLIIPYFRFIDREFKYIECQQNCSRVLINSKEQVLFKYQNFKYLEHAFAWIFDTQIKKLATECGSLIKPQIKYSQRVQC